MDFWQEFNGEDPLTITRKEIKCSVCCKTDVFTLKSIQISDISNAMTASITIVVLNRDKEITFHAKHYNLLTGFEDDEGVKDIKREYLNVSG